MADVARPREWTVDDQRQLVELHATGITMAECARKMERSASTIQRRSREAQIVWDGTVRRPGTMTRRAELEERRVSLADDLLNEAHAVLERVRQDKFRELVKGEYGSEGAADLDFIPSKSLQQMTAALKNLTSAAAELKKLDVLHNGGSDLDAWLVHMNVTTTVHMTGESDAPLRNGELQGELGSGRVIDASQ